MGSAGQHVSGFLSAAGDPTRQLVLQAGGLQACDPLARKLAGFRSAPAVSPTRQLVLQADSLQACDPLAKLPPLAPTPPASDDSVNGCHFRFDGIRLSLVVVGFYFLSVSCGLIAKYSFLVLSSKVAVPAIKYLAHAFVSFR